MFPAAADTGDRNDEIMIPATADTGGQNEIVVPAAADTGGQNDEMVVPAAAGTGGKNDEIVVPAAAGTGGQNDEMVVPAAAGTGGQNDEIVVPAAADTGCQNKMVVPAAADTGCQNEMVVPAAADTVGQIDEIVVPAAADTGGQSDKIVIPVGAGIGRPRSRKEIVIPVAKTADANANPLRLYNVKNLHKTNMHIFTKKCVDMTIRDVLYQECRVNIINLSPNDINEFKKCQTKEEFEEYLAKTYGCEPPKKETEIQEKKEEKVPETLKLVLCREGETDKFTSQFKTVNNEKERPSTSSNSSVADKAGNQESKESPTAPAVKNYLLFNVYVTNLERLFENREKFLRYRESFFSDLYTKTPSNGTKRGASSTSTNSITTTTKKLKLHLKEVERLHMKYFTKDVQDTIVIIANILNMISLSNRHHKFRMDESFKKKTEAEKLKERCDANRQHLRHKKVLEAKLKAHFVTVVSTFSENEFVATFQMFFLSILTVLRVLDQPKYKKGSIFKNLVLLLWTSLKNTDFDNSKVFGMFRSKEFRPDCIELISLIEDSRDGDPGVAERMAIYFVSTINSREHFQPAIDAVTSDSNEELAALIDTACSNSRMSSQFCEKANHSSSLPIQDPVNRTLVSSDQKPVAVENGQKWLMSKAPTQSLLQAQLNTHVNPQKTSVAVSDAPLMNDPRKFYESFSNSLNQQSSSEPSVLLPKVTVVTTATTVIPNGPLRQPTTFVIQPKIQALRPVTTASIQKSVSPNSTIVVGKTKYQLIRGPSGTMKAVPATSASATNSVVIRPALTQKAPVDVPVVRCFAKLCKNPAAIMCSKCHMVKYCSNTCQTKDWYDSHIHNCGRLQNMRPIHQKKN